MILYESNASEFINHVENNCIVKEIESKYMLHMGRRVADNEKRSWNNSMRFMEIVIRKSKISDDCGILIEYNLPQTSKRIDFIVTGEDEEQNSNFVIIELKQWEKASITDKEALVNTYLNGKIRETIHPSYQAYSYKKYMTDMNTAVHERDINAKSCAYLHNYEIGNPEPLLDEAYAHIVEDSPIFFSSDVEKLTKFINKYVGKGNGKEILYQIENGKIKPSKKFVEYVSQVFEGNDVYTLLDEQKIAYANIINIAKNSREKTAIIVNGGPGTGKSVVAMNAFVTLLEEGLNARFVAPNASFRESIVDTLGKQSRKSKKRLKALFSGSGSFVYSYKNEFDIIVCDEAHRLKKKGSFMYKGESQVEDIIKASRVSVFFVDDNQMIRLEDEGSVSKIKEVCKSQNISCKEVKLSAQFRCAGSEGYVNWLDDALQIQETGNFDGWDEGDYEFKIFDNPNDVFSEIRSKNELGFKARMLAGFAWEWTNEKNGNNDAQIDDVIIEEHNFSMPWNSRKDQYTWATDPSKVYQIGCIHTSQGLEFDYAGVIVGNDLKYDPINDRIYSDMDEYKDKGGKKGLKSSPENLDIYIKRIYKVLMTRGMKGCYVYCRDEELRKYFEQKLNK